MAVIAMLLSLNGMNGEGVFVLATVGAVAFVMSSALRHYIHRYSPREIDSTRFDYDE